MTDKKNITGFSPKDLFLGEHDRRGEDKDYRGSG